VCVEGCFVMAGGVSSSAVLYWCAGARRGAVRLFHRMLLCSYLDLLYIVAATASIQSTLLGCVSADQFTDALM